MHTTYLTQQNLPINTEGKNNFNGTSSTGDAIFRNQLGLIGKKRRKRRNPNRLSPFSFIWKSRKVFF
jgi:hypothetical protein